VEIDMRLFGIVLGLAVVLSAPVSAFSIPANGQLNFDAVRKGSDIGEMSYSFSGTPNAFTVQVTTDIEVTVPLIRTTAYIFQQNSVESWKGGTMQNVSSTTNDNGAPHQLNTESNGVLPASLWNNDIVQSSTLLNTIDGAMMNVRTADLGSETVQTKRGNVAAHHYRLTGGLARDVWYDGDGNLTQVMFKADDGSTVMYIRK
jgi:hypothetical protein